MGRLAPVMGGEATGCAGFRGASKDMITIRQRSSIAARGRAGLVVTAVTGLGGLMQAVWRAG